MYHIYRKEYTLDELRAQWHWEVLFLLCFLLMLDVRFVNPTISYAEKFMDHAFLASVIRDPVIPPLDPWFAQVAHGWCPSDAATFSRHTPPTNFPGRDA